MILYDCYTLITYLSLNHQSSSFSHVFQTIIVKAPAPPTGTSAKGKAPPRKKLATKAACMHAAGGKTQQQGVQVLAPSTPSAPAAAIPPLTKAVPEPAAVTLPTPRAVSKPAATLPKAKAVPKGDATPPQATPAASPAAAAVLGAPSGLQGQPAASVLGAPGLQQSEVGGRSDRSSLLDFQDILLEAYTLVEPLLIPRPSGYLVQQWLHKWQDKQRELEETLHRDVFQTDGFFQTDLERAVADQDAGSCMKMLKTIKLLPA